MEYQIRPYSLNSSLISLQNASIDEKDVNNNPN
jgi:hypothetical protein